MAVGLEARPGVLIPGARYMVSITNNGPQTLVSATVVVRLDPRILGTPSSPSCPYDSANDTLTCVFGALAVGSSATLSAYVYYHLPSAAPTDVDATATLTTSTPTDPEAANDSATAYCRYPGWRPGFPSLPYPPLSC